MPLPRLRLQDPRLQHLQASQHLEMDTLLLKPHTRRPPSPIQVPRTLPLHQVQRVAMLSLWSKLRSQPRPLPILVSLPRHSQARLLVRHMLSSRRLTQPLLYHTQALWRRHILLPPLVGMLSSLSKLLILSPQCRIRDRLPRHSRRLRHLGTHTLSSRLPIRLPPFRTPAQCHLRSRLLRKREMHSSSSKHLIRHLSWLTVVHRVPRSQVRQLLAMPTSLSRRHTQPLRCRILVLLQPPSPLLRYLEMATLWSKRHTQRRLLRILALIRPTRLHQLREMHMSLSRLPSQRRQSPILARRQLLLPLHQHRATNML